MIPVFNATLPLSVLLIPLVIAVMAVAFMVLMSGERTARWTRLKRSADKELGYTVPAADTVSLTPARYVGGHPDAAAPLLTPFVLLTHKDLAVFPYKGGPLAFVIPWGRTEDLKRLTGPDMAMAASGIRGLAAGALADPAPDATFVRLRYEDTNGWWQNVAFELAPEHAEAQWAAIENCFGDGRSVQPEPAPQP